MFETYNNENFTEVEFKVVLVGVVASCSLLVITNVTEKRNTSIFRVEGKYIGRKQC
jgi:hypothetical protein